MDFHCLEALLGLPEFRVTAQVCGPQQLDLHLQRCDEHIVCPRCQACCSRVKESRPRCIRDLPILEHPVMLWLHMRRFQCADCRHRPWETSETFGAQVQWTERLYTRVREECLQGCPCRELARRYGLSKRTVFRWTFERSRGGRLRKLAGPFSFRTRACRSFPSPCARGRARVGVQAGGVPRPCFSPPSQPSPPREGGRGRRLRKRGENRELNSPAGKHLTKALFAIKVLTVVPRAALA